MNANRFYTLLLVPEKSSAVRKWILPSWVFRGGLIGFVLLLILIAIMLIDYAYILGQIQENKDLKVENRRLRQQVQIYEQKIASVESTLDRIQTFSTRLKVITNIEERESITTSLNQNPPDAATNIGTIAKPKDPESRTLLDDRERLEERFSLLAHKTLNAEAELHDLYELLADQKQFLYALPTRKPAPGEFTSGFGVRKAPYGGSDKMHEGLDVANYVGTPIYATAFGTVYFAGQKPGYGQTIILDHGYGLTTLYGHTRSILVKSGQKVKRGQKIALMGNSGRSTGPHVHYEVRVNDIPVDPISYVLED